MTKTESKHTQDMAALQRVKDIVTVATAEGTDDKKCATCGGVLIRRITDPLLSVGGPTDCIVCVRCHAVANVNLPSAWQKAGMK